VPESGTTLEKHDPAAAHGEVVPAHHAAPMTYNPDAPSEQWGWHGHWSLFASRGSRVLLIVFTAVILLMVFGNHVSHVEDWYLVGTGAAMIVWLVSREMRARKHRRLRP
jgi:hypothetical protein